MRRTLALLSLLVPSALVAADFSPTPSPVSPDGTRAVCDLPVSQHLRNTGGMGPRGPGTGAGLCVFTSAEHSARWHNVPALDGFQRWMTSKPGGGWPQKLDDMLEQFCREKGVPVPSYIQHTGGDDAFLDLALKTDRLVCVTYAGSDDFYRGPIAHMVNLAHLDTTRAAIIDNNRPGVWVWMTRSEFLRRWRANGGGWAVAFLQAPPPPRISSQLSVLSSQSSCQLSGRGIQAVAGSSVLTDNWQLTTDNYSENYSENCSGGRCGVPVPPNAVPFTPGATPPTGSPPIYNGAEPPGSPPSDRYEWRPWDDAPGYGWRLRDAAAPITAPVAVENYGLEPSKIHAGRRYTLAGGAEISRDRAHALIGGDGLADDSDRWHLTAVGDAGLVSRFRADVAALPADLWAKLHVQAYAPDHWAVSLYTLPAGVSLRRPSPGRESSQVGALAPGEYTAAKLDVLLYPVSGKKPPEPPTPKPNDPLEPAKPGPAPAPVPAGSGSLWALLIAGAALVIAIFRRK